MTGIGQQLREAREARQITLEQAAQETHIRLRYLQALEADQWDALPSPAQGRGFLRLYAGFLGLDADELLTEVRPQASLPASMAPAEPPSSPGAEVASRAEDIFAEIGARLRERRELLGLSLGDVQQHTHIAERYLEALEDGRFRDLPSPVQGRGMLHNYARFLNLDADALLLRFAEGLQAQLRPPKPPSDRPRRWIPVAWRRFLPTDWLTILPVLVVMGIAVVLGLRRVFEAGPVGIAPTPPSIAEVLLGTPTFTPTPTAPVTVVPSPPLQTPFPVEGGEVATVPPHLAPVDAPVSVLIAVRQRAWMRVRVDGEVAFEGRVVPGSAYTFGGRRTVEILTGNGAALDVTVNGQPLGVLGVFGEVVDKVYTPLGPITPTPTVTPTHTPTLTPTVTPTATP